MAVDWDQIASEDKELSQQLADPAVAKDPAKLTKLARRKKELDTLLELKEALDRNQRLLKEAEALENGEDPSLRAMATEELTKRRAEQAGLQARLAELTKPTDPNDAKPAILEIRAGAGGDEASLFAKELYAMYTRYAESQGWPVELLASSQSEAGGFKEVIFRLAEGSFGPLKYEGGTHRVQRVPVTESGGRIHTSTATVAVLPEVEETEMDLNPEELRIDVFRSSGPGGQSVNTTDSAVRITHLPTGLTVSCQDEKSQHKNRAKAMQILRARLKAQQEAEAAAERGDARRAQVGTGDRSEKIRTYNLPQDRVTDHRIKRSFPSVKEILGGKIDPILKAVAEASEVDED